MRADFVDSLTRDENDELLTTGEAAKLLGVTRQHVVDLANRGDLPVVWVGAHRRVRRSDLARQTVRPKSSTRDQRRSRWLGFALAGKLVEEPAILIGQARNRLVDHSDRPRNRWDQEWMKLLDGPVDQILDALTSDSIRSRELRQNNPFVGALSQEERHRVLSAFAEYSTKGPA